MVCCNNAWYVRTAYQFFDYVGAPCPSCDISYHCDWSRTCAPGETCLARGFTGNLYHFRTHCAPVSTFFKLSKLSFCMMLLRLQLFLYLIWTVLWSVLSRHCLFITEGGLSINAVNRQNWGGLLLWWQRMFEKSPWTLVVMKYM